MSALSSRILVSRLKLPTSRVCDPASAVRHEEDRHAYERERDSAAACTPAMGSLEEAYSGIADDGSPSVHAPPTPAARPSTASPPPPPCALAIQVFARVRPTGSALPPSYPPLADTLSSRGNAGATPRRGGKHHESRTMPASAMKVGGGGTTLALLEHVGYARGKLACAAQLAIETRGWLRLRRVCATQLRGNAVAIEKGVCLCD